MLACGFNFLEEGSLGDARDDSKQCRCGYNVGGFTRNETRAGWWEEVPTYIRVPSPGRVLRRCRSVLDVERRGQNV